MTRRFLMRLATVGLAAAALLATATPASAATVTAKTLDAGTYSLFKTVGGVGLLTGPYLDTGGINVFRSTATNLTQRVTVEYRIWKFTAQTGWVTLPIGGAQTFAESADLQPGYYKPFVSKRISIDTFSNAHYSIQWTIRWKHTNGVEFASANLGYIHAGDYACNGSAVCLVSSVNGVATIFLAPLGG